MATNFHIKVTVRSAVEADIPAIADLIRPYVEEGSLLERTFDEFEELLPHFFVAVSEDGTIVGCAALEIYSRKLAEIRSLAVAASAQGQGIGRMLVDACVERAREHNILEVMAITASDVFFQSCGFDYTLPSLKRALFLQTRDHL
jgi:N-acetylglutamate synthase-like GNAT family acetyltransferase